MKTFVIFLCLVAASQSAPVAVEETTDGFQYSMEEYGLIVDEARRSYDKFTTTVAALLSKAELSELQHDLETIGEDYRLYGGRVWDKLSKAIVPALKALPADDLKALCLDVLKLTLEAYEFVSDLLEQTLPSNAEEDAKDLAELISMVAQRLNGGTKGQGSDLYKNFFELLFAYQKAISYGLKHLAIPRGRTERIPALEAMDAKAVKAYLEENF